VERFRGARAHKKPLFQHIFAKNNVAKLFAKSKGSIVTWIIIYHQIIHHLAGLVTNSLFKGLEPFNKGPSA
jgi:hypothetical protein